MEFDPIRIRILGRDPLSSLNKVFDDVQGEGGQQKKCYASIISS